MRARPPAPRRPARRTWSTTPTLREERRLLRDGAGLVAGMDEVGRGALAGPVSVGVVVVDAATRTAPPGLKDSKLLTPAAREALVPRLRRWSRWWGVGHAGPDEIDAVGILGALRLAGERALAAAGVVPDVVLLDGSHDWLTRRPDADGGPSQAEVLPGLEVVEPPRPCPPVRTLVKADMRCAAVAAASVLAKTERDAIMVRRHPEHPGYGWAANKGYSAPEHLDALSRLGPCAEHRRSWRLPGCGGDDPGADGLWLPVGADVGGADADDARAYVDLDETVEWSGDGWPDDGWPGDAWSGDGWSGDGRSGAGAPADGPVRNGADPRENGHGTMDGGAAGGPRAPRREPSTR
jgi:ribonuclease HII